MHCYFTQGQAWVLGCMREACKWFRRLEGLIAHRLTLTDAIFVDLAIVSTGYDNTVLHKVIAKIWEHENHFNKVKKEEQDNQTGCKQAVSLARLCKTLYLEVKLKVSALFYFIY